MSRERICLITTGQPSTNPRLVKEADALTAAGYDVHVVGAFWAPWAVAFDRELMSTRQWHWTMVDWRRETSALRFWKTRVRHFAARLAVQRTGALDAWCAADALSRAGRELFAAARRDAALYIAHNLGALPVAAALAAATGAKLGFDAEDFHSGQFEAGSDDGLQRFTARIETNLLKKCDYVTAAAPGMADAYRPLCRSGWPVVVLNVFPLSQRPAERPTLPAQPLRVFWFSQTIGPHRGLEAAVRSLTPFRGAVRLTLQGQWAPGYEASLRALAAREGLTPDCLVAKPPVAPDALVRAASEHHVGLAAEPGHTPNNRLAWSNKVFTYLLAGSAVVASDTPGQRALHDAIPDAMKLFAPDDVDQLADIWRGALANPDSVERMRTAAWQSATSRYNWDREQHVFLDVVRATLDAGAPGKVAKAS